MQTAAQVGSMPKKLIVVKEDFTRLGSNRAGKATEERRFARAIGTNERDDLAALEGQ